MSVAIVVIIVCVIGIPITTAIGSRNKRRFDDRMRADTASRLFWMNQRY